MAAQIPRKKATSGAYSPDASLVLIGFFGAGKKTLGIIASVTLNRTFIDFDVLFTKRTGLTPHEYLATHDSARYREAEYNVTKELLSSYGDGCVIVGIGAIGGRQQKALLEDFGRTHPVVYVRRDKTAIRKLLGCSDEQFSLSFKTGNQFYESCSNYDFFNVTQEASASTPASFTSHLTLREPARLFQRFICHLYDIESHRSLSADPLTSPYTYMLQVPLSWLEQSDVDYKELETGSDAVDLIASPKSRLTSDALSQHLSTLWTHSRAPVIFDVRLENTLHDLEHYMALLTMGLRLAPDLMTVSLSLSDESIQCLSSRKGSTKLIATCHLEHGWQVDHIHSICKRAISHNFVALQITTSGKSANDAFQLISIILQSTQVTGLPIIAYQKGQVGHASICFNPTLSPVRLPSLLDGGISLKEAQNALYSCFLLPKRKFTIFGNNLRYSPTPAMHRAAYEAMGMPHECQRLESDHFDDIWSALSDDSHGGLAISKPYKTKALSLLDEISPEAKNIHAVNTIIMEHSTSPVDNETPKMIRKGYNTDYIGIRVCIHRYTSPANAVRDGSTALIIGAGGTARAAIYACYELGFRNICIYNRTTQNAQLLADHYNELWLRESTDPPSSSSSSAKPGHPIRVHVLTSDSPWPATMRQPTVIVGCIPPFDGEGEESLPQVYLPGSWLQSPTGGVFIELAYQPRETNLMKQMKAKAGRGWVLVDGLEVFIEQGIVQFELFTKRPAPIHIMRRVIQESYSVRDNR